MSPDKGCGNAFASPFRRPSGLISCSYPNRWLYHQQIAAAQNATLSHVLADGAQPTQPLPRSVNVVHAPAPVPRAVVLLGIDQIAQSALHAGIVASEIDIP